uniref:Uncharacterized protein n=1 Tax=Cacopsylla melanoneura TaxID=428564 RepID=A0A8D8YZT3_9HEMI
MCSHWRSSQTIHPMVYRQYQGPIIRGGASYGETEEGKFALQRDLLSFKHYSGTPCIFELYRQPIFTSNKCEDSQPPFRQYHGRGQTSPGRMSGSGFISQRCPVLVSEPGIAQTQRPSSCFYKQLINVQHAQVYPDESSQRQTVDM